MMRALVIGDADREEMAPIVRWLRERISVDALRMEGEVNGRRSASDRGDVDWIVVLESHPDEYSIDDVYALFAAAPSARIVCCAGSWSESAGRTRKIWPLAVRVPATQAIQRLEREWALLTGGAETYLPATGSREEWFAAHHPALSVSRDARLGERSAGAEDGAGGEALIRIVSPDAAYRQMLTDLCTLSGFSVTTDPHAAAIVLFDADPWNADRAEELRRLSESAAVIVVTDWPLPEFQRELEAAGARCAVAKLGDQNRIVRAVGAVLEGPVSRDATALGSGARF